ncbi:MAG: ribosome maturation factor RimP [Rhodocyclaceae bacterium]|nr:ribosome maturation factor RimP [Rhodocyclaceae bacterium]
MQLRELIERTVAGLGYELVDFETSPRARLLRVFIDTPAGGSGITVEDCATVSNQLTRVFEVENVDYDRLEVSSPGLDRPLRKAADFVRFQGAEVQLRVRLPIDGQRNFTGTLAGVEGEGADMKVRLQSQAGLREIAFDSIDKARLVPKF